MYLLEGILPTVSEENANAESIFIYCVMWAFGGPVIVDKSGDNRIKLSKDFTATFGMKLPKRRLLFRILLRFRYERVLASELKSNNIPSNSNRCELRRNVF